MVMDDNVTATCHSKQIPLESNTQIDLNFVNNTEEDQKVRDEREFLEVQKQVHFWRDVLWRSFRLPFYYVTLITIALKLPYGTKLNKNNFGIMLAFGIMLDEYSLQHSGETYPIVDVVCILLFLPQMTFLMNESWCAFLILICPVGVTWGHILLGVDTGDMTPVVDCSAVVFGTLTSLIIIYFYVGFTECICSDEFCGHCIYRRVSKEKTWLFMPVTITVCMVIKILMQTFVLNKDSHTNIEGPFIGGLIVGIFVAMLKIFLDLFSRFISFIIRCKRKFSEDPVKNSIPLLGQESQFSKETTSESTLIDINNNDYDNSCDS